MVRREHIHNVQYRAQPVQLTTSVKFEPKTFSMSADPETGYDMGGFWVLVGREGKYASYNGEYKLKEAPADLGGTIINPSSSMEDETEVPYMLCLGADWHWPPASA